MEKTDLPIREMSCHFDILQSGRESRRLLDKNGHKGLIYEIGLPGGYSFGYYKIRSQQEGRLVIDNSRPFVRISYTISGSKTYCIGGDCQALASFNRQEYNYLLLSDRTIRLSWQPGEELEIFELGLSPEQMLQYLPAEHPFHSNFAHSLANNVSTSISRTNLPLHARSSGILYDMLHCRLSGAYKSLYLRGKIAELLAIQLEEHQQTPAAGRGGRIRQIDIDRMHQVRTIILSNIHSSCSLIDLAHQVGTNDAYLKQHFKQVFGTTVFGYLHMAKMTEARKLLLEGCAVSDVAFRCGYKHVAHFTRAFKRHFGMVPNQVRQ